MADYSLLFIVSILMSPTNMHCVSLSLLIKPAAHESYLLSKNSLVTIWRKQVPRVELRFESFSSRMPGKNGTHEQKLSCAAGLTHHHLAECFKETAYCTISKSVSTVRILSSTPLICKMAVFSRPLPMSMFMKLVLGNWLQNIFLTDTA